MSTNGREKSKEPNSVNLNQKDKIDKLFYDFIQNGNMEVLDHIFHQDYNKLKQKVVKFSDEKLGFIIFIQQIQNAFSDLKAEILDYIENKNKLAVRWLLTGIHTGNFLGINPTNIHVQVEGGSFFEFKDNLIFEADTFWDSHSLHSQLEGKC